MTERERPNDLSLSLRYKTTGAKAVDRTLMKFTPGSKIKIGALSWQ